MVRRLVLGLNRDAEDDDQEAREQQERCVVLRQARAEAHHPVARLGRAGDDHESEHEERVGEDRAEDRRTRHDDLAGGQREHDDEELGQVAERRLHQPRHRRPEALAHLLRRERDDPGETGERERRDHERQQRRRAYEMRDPGPERDGGDEHRDDPGAAHPGDASGRARSRTLEVALLEEIVVDRSA